MTERYIGLISGTSVDAVDAALVAFDADGRATLEATHAEPYSAELRQRLIPLGTASSGVTLQEFGELSNAVGLVFADAATALLEESGVPAEGIAAIGSHGQTLFHGPDSTPGFSLQVGNPALIAARTGIRTVADFRSADMALGGQGAPLVPGFHHALMAQPEVTRCVVNIGGIANITVLKGTDPSQVLGFDTGPGNGLMDEWVGRHLGEAFDRDGEWAASAAIHDELLNLLLSDPYLQRDPPKSTGRDYFNLNWLESRLETLSRAATPSEVQSTLAEFTVRTIDEAIRQSAPDCSDVRICGGGAHNRVLMESLSRVLDPLPVSDTADFGISPDWIEAAAFAWLARQTLQGKPGNLPSVTGAERAVPLGALYLAK